MGKEKEKEIVMRGVVEVYRIGNKTHAEFKGQMNNPKIGDLAMFYMTCDKMKDNLVNLDDIESEGYEITDKGE